MTSLWSDYRPNPWRSLTLKINDILHIQLIKGPVQKNQNNQWFLKQSSFQISVYTTNRQWFSPRWYTYINMWEWLPKQVDSYYRESHDITCTFDSKKQFQPIKMLIRLGQPRVSTPGYLLWRTTSENDLQCHLQHLAGNDLTESSLVMNIRFCDIDYGMVKDLFKLSELCNKSLWSLDLFVWLVN